MQTHGIDSSSVESALKRGVAAARAGLLSIATSQFERAVENDPEDPNVWLWLGWAANSPDNTIRCLEEVLRLSPGHAAATAGLTWARSLAYDRPATAATEPAIKSDCVISVSTSALEQVSVPEEARTSAPDVGVEAVAVENEQAAPETTLEAPDQPDDDWGHTPAPTSAEAVTEAVCHTIQEAQSQSPPAELSRQWDALLHRDTDATINSETQPSAEPESRAPQLPSPLQMPTGGETLDEPPRLRFAEQPVAPRPNAGSSAETSSELEAVESSFRPSTAAPSDDGRPLVMVVDDSPTVRKLVSLTLERRGYRVISAFDGIAAIKELGSSRPDLILLDINMPRLDGYRLCKLIKKHDATQNIPVVMLSGKDGMFDKLRGRLVGCSDYITKPFEADALTHKVAKYLTSASSSL